jgi:hypothetical protein
MESITTQAVCVLSDSHLTDIYRNHNKTFNILTGTVFQESNHLFTGMCKRLRKFGKGKVRHKNPIDKGDIKKLYEHPHVFNICTPSGLLNKVWFEVLLYFCR